MNTNNKTTATNAIATVASSAKVETKVETIKPLASIAALLKIEGDKVTVPKGADLSPSELALYIASEEQAGNACKTRARWTYYSAGLLQNGGDIQAAIKGRLDTMLSKSAVYQLTSEATTLCPLVIAEGLKVPLSLLKDAKAELAIDEKTGKLAPMSKQTKAAKALIPLLKSGEVTQGAIREIRKANATSAPTKPTSPKEGPKAKDNAEAIEFGLMAGKLADVNTYLEKTKLAGDDKQKFVNLATALCRALGLAVS